MADELRSRERPTPLRIAGFACAAAGALLAGVGATREWASVGLRADLQGVADVAVNGTDVWEGKVVLFSALVAVVVLLAIRLARSSSTRRGLAIGLVVLGMASAAMSLADGIRAEDRFGGTAGVDLLAERLAADLELPEDVVREQLEQALQRELRVDAGVGLWISSAGGVALAAGGLLNLAWVRRRPWPPDVPVAGTEPVDATPG